MTAESKYTIFVFIRTKQQPITEIKNENYSHRRSYNSYREKHIKALFDHKMTEGKVNTKTYYISENEGIYIAQIYEMEYSDFEQKRVMRKRKVSFSVKQGK